MRLIALILLAAGALAIGAGPASAAPPDPVLAALQRAEATGALPAPQGAVYRQILAQARAVRAGLRGVRRRELAAVLTIAGRIAKRGDLVPARMPAVFLTLQRNAEWWAVNGPPAPGSPGENGARGRRCRPLRAVRAARVEFPGSELVFQYYRGMGLQLQMNGTWGKANALFASSNPVFTARGAALLSELLPLGVARAGVLAWEYLFPVYGGRPPWISGLAQATAVQAITRAAAKLGRPDLLGVAGATASAFAFPPPSGVRSRVGRGAAWFVLYSFAPRQRVLNAHLDALAALFDLTQASGNVVARISYERGLLAARRRIRGYDTGKWSKYANPGALADLNYHVLNTTLAGEVCKRSGDARICGAAGSFARELERRCPRVGVAADARTAATEAAGGR